jgi:hypothetical protein
VADAGFDPDAPVAQAFERPGLLQLVTGPAGRAGALQPDAPDAELGEGAVACGEPEAAVGDHGEGAPGSGRPHHRRADRSPRPGPDASGRPARRDHPTARVGHPRRSGRAAAPPRHGHHHRALQLTWRPHPHNSVIFVALPGWYRNTLGRDRGERGSGIHPAQSLHEPMRTRRVRRESCRSRPGWRTPASLRG